MYSATFAQGKLLPDGNASQPANQPHISMAENQNKNKCGKKFKLEIFFFAIVCCYYSCRLNN